jgi:hypothetical protein
VYRVRVKEGTPSLLVVFIKAKITEAYVAFALKIIPLF